MVDAYDEFRQLSRDWLDQNCPPEMRTPASEEADMVWSGRRLHFSSKAQQTWFEAMREKGWFAPDWPHIYGGGGLDARQCQILEQEMRALKCRQPQINLGIWMLGPVLLKHGTEAQKKHHLSAMTRGEIRWCQGFSEPNAGSDLASLQMRATASGDDYIVNGSKIWTSYANLSDWIYALVRTRQSGKKHDGISMLLIDMASPGIEVKGIDLISGKSHFCEIFFNEVHVKKSNLVGKEHQGWSLAKELMFHERQAIAKLGDEGQTPYKPAEIARLYQDGKQSRISDPALRERVIQAEMDDRAYQATLLRTNEEAKLGIEISGVSSTFKFVGTEMEKRKTELLRECAGSQALCWHDKQFTEDEQAISRAWLNAKALSIGGGTSEVQLNIIAKRILALPD